MAETASEAMGRATQAAIDLVRDACDLRAPADLRPGMSVKCAGEWYTLDRVTERGDLLCRGDGGQPFFYAVTEGETFVWRWES